MGEKDGVDAEHALIASTAYDGDALRLPIFDPVFLADALITENDSGNELVQIGASIVANVQQDGVPGVSKLDGQGGPH